MEIIFEKLDELMAELRDNHLRGVLVTGLIVWLAGDSLIGYTLARVGGGLIDLVFFLALPLGLIGAVAGWGLGGLEWPLWPIGMGPPVLAGGVILPAIEQAVPKMHLKSNIPAYFLFSLIGYVYVQIFLGVLVSVDEYRKRWLDVRKREQPPGAQRTAQRRVLQLKLLMTIAIISADVIGASTHPDTHLLGWQVTVFLIALPLCAIALFVRMQWSARTAAAILGSATLVYAAIAIGERQLSDLVGTGWTGVLGAYLFAKAARRDYWPLGSADVAAYLGPSPYQLMHQLAHRTTGRDSALGTASLAVSGVAVMLCCCGADTSGSLGPAWQVGAAAVGGIGGVVGALCGHLALGRIARLGQSGEGTARAGLRLGWLIATAASFYFLDVQSFWPAR